MSRTASTLMVTTKCSAGCLHCPFAAPGVPALHLKNAEVHDFFRTSSASMVVISGGEPFEHPGIGSLLSDLQGESLPFRIATGGHVPLSPFLLALSILTNRNPAFGGVSLGTDVLAGRARDPSAAQVWRENLMLLKQAEIPFSLTVTLGEGLGDIFANSLAGISAQFFYVRHVKGSGKRAAEWAKNLGLSPVILDAI